MKAKLPGSYQDAKKELENILQDVEAGELDLDLLISKAERAKFLIIFCKEKLRSTQEKLDPDQTLENNPDSEIN